MFGLALLFVYVFFCPFSILITLLEEEGAGLCAYRAFFVSCAHVNLCHFFSSSWCRWLAAASACGSSWTYLFTFLSTRCCIPSFIDLLAPKEIFEGFYHIWAWKPSWSCDLEHLNTFSSQHHMEAAYELRLQTAKCFLRKRSLKMLNLNDLGQRSVNEMTLDCQKESCTHLFDYMYQFSTHRLQ